MPLAIEAFGHIVETGQQLLDQMATSVTRRHGGEAFSQKGVVFERLRENLSVALQMAISRWVLTAVRRADDNPRVSSIARGEEQHNQRPRR